MAQVFISYSHKDRAFVHWLRDALAAQKREAWVDWRDIPPTAEWLKEIFANIEAADDFLFVISPDSIVSASARKEIDHAAINNKRIVPILYRAAPDLEIPEAVAKFQRIDFSGSGDLDGSLAKLIKALDNDLAWVQMHTRLLIRAKEWQRERKDGSFLLRGKDLREAEQWIAKSAEGEPQQRNPFSLYNLGEVETRVTKSAENEPKPTTLQSQYILASRRAATTVQRFVIGAAVVAILIAVALAVYAFRQKGISEQNARESKAGELAAYATDSLGDDLERSILLGMQAVNVTLRSGQPPLPASEEALHHAILSSQLRLTLRGHSNHEVNSAVFSPDGKRLATAGGDGVAKVWDLATGQEILTLHGHTGALYSAAWSPDGQRLATASKDGTAKVWDAVSGHEVLTLRGHTGAVYSVAWSPDGHRLATASGDQTAKLWNAANGREVLALRHKGSVLSVAWSPDGHRLATASEDQRAKVWDATSGKELVILRGHNGVVTSVVWSLDGGRLATASEDNTAKVWDATSGKDLLTLRGHTGVVTTFSYFGESRNSVHGVTFSPDGMRLATASDDKTARVWDMLSGRELVSLRGHSDAVLGVAFSPDGASLATASSDGTAKVWDALNRQELLTLRDHHTFSCVAYGADSKRLATGSDDKTAKVWDATSGKELLTLRGHDRTVNGLAWSPDDKRLATASGDTTAKVWDAASGKKLLTLVGHDASVNSVAWSPDGKRLATGSDDETAKVWDSYHGQELLTLRGHTSHVYRVAYSPDGSRLATASGDGTARVWDARNGQNLLVLGGSPFGVSVHPVSAVLSVAFSPDGKRLATANEDSSAKVWDALTGQELLTLRGHSDAVTDVAFSPDGKRLATVSRDETAKLWDAASGQESLTLRGHSEAPMGWDSRPYDKDEAAWLRQQSAFSRLEWGATESYWSDSKRPDVVSSGLIGKSDNTARASDARRREPQPRFFRGHLSSEVRALAFSPDAKRLATASNDGTVQVYALDIHDLLKLAHSRVTRDLTPDECKRYFKSEECPPLP